MVDPAESDLQDSTITAARTALADLGADTGEPDWLAAGIACDLPFDYLAPEQADAAVRLILDWSAIDVVAQPIAGRRKRLLVADMDSTMVTTETLDELAEFAGLGGRIGAITARAMNGEIDFVAALRERVALLAGLSADALDRTWERVAFTRGAGQLVATMRAAGALTVLASGGFTVFTERVRLALGFDHDEGNRLEIADGRLTGRVLPPILGREAKLATLIRHAAERRLPLAATLAVGDGANDLAMIQAAGLGVAFHAKPIVAHQARIRIDHGDLTALLYAQGYRAEDIVG